MRASAVAAVILGAVASASASSLVARQDSYPTCALSCIANPDIGSCSSISDTKCLCTNEAFVTGMTKCINGACTGKDLQNALTFASGLCLKVGVTLAPPAATGATSSAATGSASASAPAASTTHPASGSASASGSAAASHSAVASSASAAPTKAASSAASSGANAVLGLFAAGLTFFAL